MILLFYFKAFVLRGERWATRETLCCAGDVVLRGRRCVARETLCCAGDVAVQRLYPISMALHIRAAALFRLIF